MSIRVLPSFALVIGLLASGCTTAGPSPVEVGFGDSVRELRTQQVANPQAGSEAPVVGLSPSSADDVVRAHRERLEVDNQDGATRRSQVEE